MSIELVTDSPYYCENVFGDKHFICFYSSLITEGMPNLAKMAAFSWLCCICVIEY